jgi:hypothetical protein
MRRTTRPTTKDIAMKKLSIALDLRAPAALLAADLALIEGGAAEQDTGVRPVGVETEEQWQEWLKKHPQTSNGKPYQATPSGPSGSSGGSSPT